MTQASQQSWVDDVLTFWFETLDRKGWFTKSAETDALIRDRFLGTYERVIATDDAALLSDARIALAAIIVVDQFPRNMFRGDPQSFASDAKALRLAKSAVSAGFDAGLTVDERAFLYLPFEHSEAVDDQDRAVGLMSALGDEEYTRYAEAHRDVIRRFGRFPHRNAILGRVSTPEEEAYLAQPGSGF